MPFLALPLNRSSSYLLPSITARQQFSIYFSTKSNQTSTESWSLSRLSTIQSKVAALLTKTETTSPKQDGLPHLLYLWTANGPKTHCPALGAPRAPWNMNVEPRDRWPRLLGWIPLRRATFARLCNLRHAANFHMARQAN